MSVVLKLKSLRYPSIGEDINKLVNLYSVILLRDKKNYKDTKDMEES
jgi:hypothetical protein